MRDVDDLIRALEPPAAPDRPPRPAPAWPRWVALAAAALLVGWWLIPAPGPAPRGIGASVVALDLRMVVVRGGVAVRVGAGQSLARGEQVLFRVSSDPPGAVRVWVEGPEGTQSIAEIDAGPVPRDVADGAGLVGYRVERSGRYRFHLEPRGGGCADCPVLALEVR